MKTPLGTEVDPGPGHIVLDGDPALPERVTAAPSSIRPMSIVATVAHLRLTTTAELLLQLFQRSSPESNAAVAETSRLFTFKIAI